MTDTEPAEPAEPAGPAEPAEPAGPAHSIRPRLRPARIALFSGAAAALVAIGVGTAALINAPTPTPSAHQTLKEITVTAATIPLSDPDILALLDRAPDYGPTGTLGTPQGLASCLRGLDYPPDTRVLGARPVQIDGRPSVLLLLPGDSVNTVMALAVAPNCNSVDTGLVADTSVRRP